MADTIPARSPADVFNSPPAADGVAGGKPIGDDDGAPDVGDPIQRLEAAQARDRGTPAPAAPPAKPDAPPAPSAKPFVPGAPAAPAVEPEWKPKGEAAVVQWEKLKSTHAAEAAALKAQIATAQAELTAARQNGSTPDEIKALKEELASYKTTLKDVAIERDPEFQKRFSIKERSAIDAAKLAAGDKSTKLEELLKQPTSPWRDEQINAIIDDLPASSQRRVNAALGLLEQIDVERSAEIAQRRTDFEQRQALTVQQQKEQQNLRVQEFTKAFTNQLSAFTDPKTGHPFLVERPGDDAYNKEVAESRDLASSLHKSFLEGQLTADDIAKAMLHVAVSSRMMKQAQEAVARADKAEKALDRRRATVPGDGRQGMPSSSDNGEKVPEPGTPEYVTWSTHKLAEAQAKDRLADMSQGRIV